MQRTHQILILTLVFALSVAFSVEAQESSPAATVDDVIVASIRDVNDQEIGLAAVSAGANGQVSVAVIARGLEPGEHGLHIHETGVCDAAGDSPFTSAGGHFNPTSALHGDHAGDLGNGRVDEKGDLLLVANSDQFTLADGETSLRDADGSAVVIHAGRDDLTTDPSGDSGSRIACAVLVAAS